MSMQRVAGISVIDRFVLRLNQDASNRPSLHLAADSESTKRFCSKSDLRCRNVEQQRREDSSLELTVRFPASSDSAVPRGGTSLVILAVRRTLQRKQI